MISSRRLKSEELSLPSELARRCVANPQYSLRSFALHLGINHSTLSQLLRGKRPLTARAIEKLGQRLGLGQDEVNVALQRLLRLGLLEMTGHERWLDKSGVAETDQDEFARLVIQRLSEQVRRLSITATHNPANDQAVTPTTRITIKSSDLPLVTEMIERLQRQSSESLNDGEYELEITLHPINHHQTKE
jgi:plasmid maintenance system antidote protein VapI